MILLFLDSLGGGELLVVMLFALFFFGSKKIPDIARGVGRASREFKDAMNNVKSELESNMNAETNIPVKEQEEKIVAQPNENSVSTSQSAKPDAAEPAKD